MAKILKEYGNNKKTREGMADAAKRRLKKGDASTYNNAINSLTKRGSTREEFDDFIKRFESNNEINKQPANKLANENRTSIKLTEQQLKAVIRESVNRILREIENPLDSEIDVDILKKKIYPDHTEKMAKDSIERERDSGVKLALDRLGESVINRAVKKSIQEAFKSPKLNALAKQHGGINKNGYGFLDDNDLSISELTDDMIGDEAVEAGKGDFGGFANNAVNFKDGTNVPITNMQAARQMQKDWNDEQDRNLRYNNGGINYQKHVQPTFNRAMRQDLKTANHIKNDPNQGYANQKRWADWERKARPSVRKAYNGQGNLEQMMQQ